MSLEKFAWTLFLILIAVILFFICAILVFYYRTRKRSNNYFDDPTLKLRYFIQPQVDFRGKVVGYECLLREHQPDGSWRLPRFLDSLPLQRVIVLLEETFLDLPDNKISLAINLSYEQIMSPEFLYFVRWAISKISPSNLTVEYRPSRTITGLNLRKFKNKITRARMYGMTFAIDNVDSELRTLKRIEFLLPVIDVLKGSMNSFRKDDPSIWLDLNLQFWNKLANEHSIKLYLMGIENEEDQQLAEQLKIQFRQGYLFGKPIDSVHDDAKNESTDKE